MELPNVTHPKRIPINGFTYEVVTHFALTDAQALALAMFHHRQHPPKKSNKKKIVRILSVIDQDAAALL